MKTVSDIQRVMGFSGFGGKCCYVQICQQVRLIMILGSSARHLGHKTAMKFDLEKMFEETRRTAREYSEQITGLYSHRTRTVYNMDICIDSEEEA